MQELINFLTDSILYILSVNVILYLYSSIKLHTNKSLNLLTLYLVLIFLNQVVAHFFTVHLNNNLFLFHTYLIIQFVSLSFFYKTLFSKKQKKLVDVLLVIVLAFLIGYYLIWPKDFAWFNLPEILIATIPVLAYIMIHLYNSLTTKGEYLYFSGALLIYLSISTFVFLLYALLTNQGDDKILNVQTVRNIADINAVCYILFQIVLFIEWKVNISKWKVKKAS